MIPIEILNLTNGSAFGTKGLILAKIDKLIQQAITSPQNLTFNQLCTLCLHFGMKLRKKRGSHRIYKREYPPKFTISIQDDDGKAKPYQVKQLLDKVKEHGLYDFKQEEG